MYYYLAYICKVIKINNNNLKHNKMKTQKQVRESFWNAFPEFKSEYRKTYTQNQYRCDIRCCFVDYVDSLAKNGEISEKLAQRVTL